MGSWDDARIFLAVIRAQSFTGAARSLALNQSTVSRRIAELEGQLGRPLFHRTARAFKPTELALRLRPQAETIEKAMTGWQRLALTEDRPEGVVRVATAEELTSGFLIPALPKLCRDYPGLQLEILGGARLVDLERGEADIAVRVIRPSQGDLVHRRLTTFTYRVFGTRALVRQVRSRSLAEVDWVALDDPQHRIPEAQWVDAQLGTRRPVLRTNNTLDLAHAAAAGLGLALLPDAVATRHRSLVCLSPGSKPILNRDLWIVTPRSLAKVPRVRAVMAWITDVCAGDQRDAGKDNSGRLRT